MAQNARAEERLMALLSRYLTENADFVTAEMAGALMAEGADARTAFSLLLAAGMGLDVADDPEDMRLYRSYFPRMVRRLAAEQYRSDPFYKAVGVVDARGGSCRLSMGEYKPFEAFVRDDIEVYTDGARVPQIGFFEEPFAYPALFEGERLWMSVTPNEVSTMADPIGAASGRVLAFGLGLGYFAYMAARKPCVESVTVIENNRDVIALFEGEILPRLGLWDKISIVEADAFDYARETFPKGLYDFVFTDLWHDPSDGAALYLRMKAMEELAPGARHEYWIEKTLKHYI